MTLHFLVWGSLGLDKKTPTGLCRLVGNADKIRCLFVYPTLEPQPKGIIAWVHGQNLRNHQHGPTNYWITALDNWKRDKKETNKMTTDYFDSSRNFTHHSNAWVKIEFLLTALGSTMFKQSGFISFVFQHSFSLFQTQKLPHILHLRLPYDWLGIGPNFTSCRLKTQHKLGCMKTLIWKHW